MNDTTTTPSVITRYLATADAQDAHALAACFAADGAVTDEGITYTGRDEIVRWRTEAVSKWTYTSEVTGTEPAGDGYLVFVHVVGNFPGGETDLTYTFTLTPDGGQIAVLTIVE